MYYVPMSNFSHVSSCKSNPPIFFAIGKYYSYATEISSFYYCFMNQTPILYNSTLYLHRSTALLLGLHYTKFLSFNYIINNTIESF